jgi:hypothetical protein
MKTEFRGFLKRISDDEGGQGTVEYILLLSITVIGAVTFSRAILNTLDKAVLRVGGQMEKDLKSGRAPLNVWEN